jgi:hypothetical protein
LEKKASSDAIASRPHQGSSRNNAISPDHQVRVPQPLSQGELEADQGGGGETNTQVVQKAEVTGLIAISKDLILRIENAELTGQHQTLHQSVVECERLNEEIAREPMKRIGNRGVVSRPEERR